MKFTLNYMLISALGLALFCFACSSDDGGEESTDTQSPPTTDTIAGQDTTGDTSTPQDTGTMDILFNDISTSELPPVMEKAEATIDGKLIQFDEYTAMWVQSSGHSDGLNIDIRSSTDNIQIEMIIGSIEENYKGAFSSETLQSAMGIQLYLYEGSGTDTKHWQAVGGTDDGSTFSIEITEFGDNGEFIKGTFEMKMVDPGGIEPDKVITNGIFEIMRKQ